MIQRRTRSTRTNSDSPKGFLWRSSPKFQHVVREDAKDLQLSQNAYITYALMVRAMKRQAPPPPRAALEALLGEMSAAIPNEENVLGQCVETDWNALRRFIETLQVAGIIAGVTTRNQAPATTIYSFHFTPEGREVWNAVKDDVMREIGT